jgi:mRNA-degrading endonuclease toxin of MazEF toxin-antitoxin module
MTIPLQGAIYLWPDVPENHPMGIKNRRWVVVSREAFNADSEHVLACPITSSRPGPPDIPVQATPHNRLDHDSVIRVTMITPIKKDELGAALARLSTRYTRQVIDKLRLLVEV